MQGVSESWISQKILLSINEAHCRVNIQHSSPYLWFTYRTVFSLYNCQVEKLPHLSLEKSSPISIPIVKFGNQHCHDDQSTRVMPIILVFTCLPSIGGLNLETIKHQP
jgi:hypothetical protein